MCYVCKNSGPAKMSYILFGDCMLNGCYFFVLISKVLDSDYHVQYTDTRPFLQKLADDKVSSQ